jgi:hypothetical protein
MCGGRPVSYTLSQEEMKTIDSYCDAFWDDVRVIDHKKAVIVFVFSPNSNFDYPHLLGIYDEPDEVIKAIECYPGYVERSQVSAARMGRGVSRAYGMYDVKDIELECKKLLIVNNDRGDT